MVAQRQQVLKEVLRDGEKEELKQILVCTSAMRREIDDQFGATNDAGSTCRVWRFGFIEMKKPEGARETHVLITLYEVHFEPKAGEGQAIDLHEHKAMRDWMVDEARKRLEDRPEIHIQLGQRVDSDQTGTAWQPQSWQDKCKTAGLGSYLLLVHVMLVWCLVEQQRRRDISRSNDLCEQKLNDRISDSTEKKLRELNDRFEQKLSELSDGFVQKSDQFEQKQSEASNRFEQKLSEQSDRCEQKLGELRCQPSGPFNFIEIIR